MKMTELERLKTEMVGFDENIYQELLDKIKNKFIDAQIKNLKELKLEPADYFINKLDYAFILQEEFGVDNIIFDYISDYTISYIPGLPSAEYLLVKFK